MVIAYKFVVLLKTLKWLRKPYTEWSIFSILEIRRVHKGGCKITRTWMGYECCRNAVWVNGEGQTFSPLSHFSYFLLLEWISVYTGKHSTELRALSSSFAVFLKQASTVTCKLMPQLHISIKTWMERQKKIIFSPSVYQWSETAVIQK